MDPGGDEPTVNTGSATKISATGATLSASFSGIPTSPAPTAAFFRYGTSASSLTDTVYDIETLLNSATGNFSADIASLSPNTTYYYQAVMTLGDGTDVEGEILSFTTTSGSTSVDRKYLDNYEIPAVTVLTYSTGKETQGGTPYYSYTTSNSNQMVVSHTFEYGGNTLHNFSLLYDKTKKAALWVAFAMHHDIYPWLEDRYDSWKPDPGIPSTWQPNLSSAYNESSTYSRGHQVASNDRRTTEYQTKQTTYYSNMTPQISGFNGGVWATLEGDIQKIGNATTGNDMLYVVTGPIFGSGYGTTDDKYGTACAVPTQYFKCIMKVTLSGGVPVSATGAAYLMDHKSGATRQNVSIDYIEDLTGFDFFANIPKSIQDGAEDDVHPTSYFPQQALPTS